VEPAAIDDCSISEPFMMGQSQGAKNHNPRRPGLLAEQRADANTATGGKQQGAINAESRDQKPYDRTDRNLGNLRPAIVHRSLLWPFIPVSCHAQIIDAELKRGACLLSMVNFPRSPRNAKIAAFLSSGGDF